MTWAIATLTGVVCYVLGLCHYAFFEKKRAAVTLDALERASEAMWLSLSEVDGIGPDWAKNQTPEWKAETERALDLYDQAIERIFFEP